MVFSNHRKLLLSGWLQENGSREYSSPLKLQKYLLFYEAFSKIDGDVTDFSYMKGYKRGPVFSHVWGDYTHDRTEFDEAASAAYQSSKMQIDINRAKRSQFIVSIMSENELSDLTHKMNLWKSQEARIMSGEQQVALSENDFNDDDTRMMKILSQMYPDSLIDDSSVIEIDSHYFVFHKETISQLTELDFDTLSLLSEKEELHNPVFVEKDDEGRLIVD